MFNDFSHRHVDCLVDGVPEKMILTREKRSITVIHMEYLFIGTFFATSVVQSGSIVDESDSYLVQAVRLMTEGDRYCSLVRTNANVEVQRFAQSYDANDNPIGETFNSVQSNVKAYAQYVTARLRQEDIGLLPTTAYVLYLQTSVNVKRPQEPSLVKPDRIILNGRPYQVDVVDDVKIPGLYYVQLSEDTR